MMLRNFGGKSAGTMSLLELGPITFGGTPAIITFLQRKSVLVSSNVDAALR